MRTAEIIRKTKETDIILKLNIDGVGKSVIDSGSGFLDHMLTLFAKHGRFDLEVKCVGDTFSVQKDLRYGIRGAYLDIVKLARRQLAFEKALFIEAFASVIITAAVLTVNTVIGVWQIHRLTLGHSRALGAYILIKSPARVKFHYLSHTISPSFTLILINVSELPLHPQGHFLIEIINKPEP